MWFVQSINKTEIMGNVEMADDPKEVIVKDIPIEIDKERIQNLQNIINEEMRKTLGVAAGEKIHEVASSDLKEFENYDHNDNSYNYQDRKKSDKAGGLPEKYYIPRDSLLTDLFRINHIRTIFNICIAMLIILLLNTVIYDVMETGRPNFGFQLIIWSFGELPTVILIWLCMLFAILGLYFCSRLYATRRRKFLPKSTKLWDLGWLCTYIIYCCLFVYVPLHFTLYHGLPPASSLIVIMEQSRLVMKYHAFVRTNVFRAIQFKSENCEDNKCSPPYPEVSTFLFFLCVPTLVYRDSYPRTKQIHWRQVAWSFMEVVGAIFFMSFIFERLLIPEFQRFGQHHLSVKCLILAVIRSIMPSMLVLLCSFFCVLHSWHNVMAEVTCFADRMFYKDWWNCTSFSTFYRTWNTVIHDWLYTYIYKDFCQYVFPNNKLIPKMMVFALSALAHEYVFIFTFRYFYPVMFLMFGGIGFCLSFVTVRKYNAGNIFFWLALCIGTGLFVSLFSIEWYARINCPPFHNALLDYFIPRSWTCKPQNSAYVC